MNEGDLVHIPQGTELWIDTDKGMRMRISEKPIAGVYLDERSQYIYRVYANGHWNVKKSDVYPMGQPC